MTLLGVAILLLVVALLGQYLVLLLKGAHRPAVLVGAVLLSYSLLFGALVPVGRLCLGLQAAFQSRYITLLIPAFLALYFSLLSKSWSGRRNLVLTLWVLLILPAAVSKPWQDIRWYSSGKRDWANCFVRTANLEFCDQTANFFLHTPAGETGLQEKLDYLKQHRLNLFSEAKPQ